jgi:hypothetical protein
MSGCVVLDLFCKVLLLLVRVLIDFWNNNTGKGETEKSDNKEKLKVVQRFARLRVRLLSSRVLLMMMVCFRMILHILF